MSSKKAVKSAGPKIIAKVKNPGWHATSPAIVKIKKGVDVTPSKRKGGGLFDGLLAIGRVRGQRYEKWLEQRLALVYDDVDYVNKIRKMFGYDETDISGRGQLTKKQLEEEVCERDPKDQKIIDPKLNCQTKKGGGRKTTCVKQTLKKYTTRKSPPYPANKCKTKKKKGNDGKFYISKPKGGTYKWVPFSGHTKTKKKK